MLCVKEKANTTLSHDGRLLEVTLKSAYLAEVVAMQTSTYTKWRCLKIGLGGIKSSQQYLWQGHKRGSQMDLPSARQ